jgi:hypothetical protein
VRGLGVEERLFPGRVAEVDVHRRIARRLGRGDGRLDVGHLERQVVRARPVAVEETAQEVAVVDRVGLEHLEAHVVGVFELTEREADAGTVRVPDAAEVEQEPGPRIGALLDRDGDVVEVGAVDHRPRMSTNRSRCSRTMRPVEK